MMGTLGKLGMIGGALMLAVGGLKKLAASGLGREVASGTQEGWGKIVGTLQGIWQTVMGVGDEWAPFIQTGFDKANEFLTFIAGLLPFVIAQIVRGFATVVGVINLIQGAIRAVFAGDFNTAIGYVLKGMVKIGEFLRPILDIAAKIYNAVAVPVLQITKFIMMGADLINKGITFAMVTVVKVVGTVAWLIGKALDALPMIEGVADAVGARVGEMVKSIEGSPEEQSFWSDMVAGIDKQIAGFEAINADDILGGISKLAEEFIAAGSGEKFTSDFMDEMESYLNDLADQIERQQVVDRAKVADDEKKKDVSDKVAEAAGLQTVFGTAKMGDELLAVEKQIAIYNEKQLRVQEDTLDATKGLVT